MREFFKGVKTDWNKIVWSNKKTLGPRNNSSSSFQYCTGNLDCWD